MTLNFPYAVYALLCLVFPYSSGAKMTDESIKYSNGANLTKDSLQFIALGDWGKGGNAGDITSLNTFKRDEFSELESPFNLKSINSDVGPLESTVYTYQAAVASAMSQWSDIHPQDFIVALGDNFYTNGVSSTSDSLWQTLWSDVYLSSYMNLRVPWYPVFGNHDYSGGSSAVQAQIDKKLSNDYWKFEERNYTKYFNIPEAGLLAMIFIDTTTLAPSENSCCNSKGGISSSLQAERIANQLANIERMLQEATNRSATWIIMCGHYPVFSHGEHGDTDELKTYLLPLIEQYGVRLYLSGHDHISEHLMHNNVDYFVSGAGSMTSSYYSSVTTDAEVMWYGEKYSAFTSVEVTFSNITVKVVHWSGEVKYQYTIHNLDTLPPTYPPTYRPTVRPTLLPTMPPTLAHMGGDIYTETDSESRNWLWKWSHFMHLQYVKHIFERHVLYASLSCACLALLLLLSLFVVKSFRRKKYGANGCKDKKDKKDTDEDIHEVTLTSKSQTLPLRQEKVINITMLASKTKNNYTSLSLDASCYDPMQEQESEFIDPRLPITWKERMKRYLAHKYTSHDLTTLKEGQSEEIMITQSNSSKEESFKHRRIVSLPV